jgi:hypothetical protein
MESHPSPKEVKTVQVFSALDRHHIGSLFLHLSE